MAHKSREREVYDIDRLTSFIDKNATEAEPVEYNAEKMAIYATNINIKRYICEIKDSLKPVQRRILLTMYEQHLYNGKRSKCAQVVGEVVKKYHPHGDDAAYGVVVNMGQTWRNNITLVDTKTNFGSAYDPDGYAASRYTDCGLSEFAYDCFFKDWKFTNPKNDMTVDWTDNYDGSYLEPMYLPAKYPLFLLNWHKAMGLGRYTSTIGFNLTEAFNAVIELIDNPNADINIYPEDPNGCTLINKKDLRNILDQTDIKVRMRSNYNISHYNGKDIIEIVSVPYEVQPITIKEAIQKLAEKGELPEISDIDGCSENLGKTFRISIEVKKGYDPHAIMTKLYKKTQLEQTYVMKYAFVNGLESVDYTLRIAILEWLRFRRQTIKRMYKIRRVNNLKRMHFLEPLIKVIKSGEIEEFIRIVRKNDTDSAVKKIMKAFNLTDYQAENIVSVKISDLSTNKLNEYEKELKELLEEDKYLAEMVQSKKKINKLIIKQLKEGIEKYGSPRKTKITQLIDSVQIPDTYHYLIFTNKYVKKLPYDDRGYRIGRIDNGEKVLKVMAVSNRDTIAIFTQDGKCLPICVNDIGNSSTAAVGISYTTIGAKDNNFANAFVMNEELLDKYIVSVTEDGLISKTSYDEIKDKKKVFAFMKLGKNDKLRDVCIVSNKKDELLVFTSYGNGALFPFNDFETTSLNTKGVQSAKLLDGEKVIGVRNISRDKTELVTLSDRGYMKKFSLQTLPSTKRNGKCIELNSSNGSLIDVKAINGNDNNIYICATPGAFEIDPANINTKSRISKSIRVVELKAIDYAFGLM